MSFIGKLVKLKRRIPKTNENRSIKIHEILLRLHLEENNLNENSINGALVVSESGNYMNLLVQNKIIGCHKELLESINE